ncbi:hypothetical protein F5X68DRAFT_261068 [Plectosphaerella plurivora]|uniref:RGS domain-containing protein n=1 Tax=Plectosphaerella plurivora TaxID=936078 RepID=A0A9P8VDX0_9PEZI|nr:hypothetical protein F5X68DRAFT_261068 [Plectosphaerella plurivora]
MSLKFYRKPVVDRPWRPPVMDEDCGKYNLMAAKTKKWLPPSLHFEQLVRNTTMPPCSLNDFMDYLVYVEQNAEPLQFFLWFCGYVRSWTELTAQERALVPRYDPARAEEALVLQRHLRQQHELRDGEGDVARSSSSKRKRGPKVRMLGRERRARNASKVSNILDILDAEVEDEKMSRHSAASAPSLPPPGSIVFNGLRPGTASSAASAIVGGLTPLAPEDQPFRDEITRVLGHYIQSSGARRLDLAVPDRASVLAATACTTHPTALLPAFEKSDALLRGKLHPNFIRASMANTNRPTTFLLRLLGILLIILGLGADLAFIILTPRFRLSRYWRIACFGLLAPGLAIFVASVDGLSLYLYFRGRRQLRPWEVEPLLPRSGRSSRSSSSSNESEAKSWKKRRHLRKGSEGSIGTMGADPLRKGSLRTFGPANVFQRDEWVEAYARRSFWTCWFEETLPAGQGEVGVLQAGVVLSAFIWAFLLAGGMAAGSVFVPAYDIFNMRWA